jgi:pyruvate/2-oxoglutarate/acetoin dehydrogenase E1 component
MGTMAGGAKTVVAAHGEVGAKLTPVPFSTILEKAILPQSDDILAAIGRVAGY